MSLPLSEKLDADFFALVSHLVEEDQRHQQEAERRGNERRDFRCVQLVAPMLEGRMPSRSDFRHVRCMDLSSQGFSYYQDEDPSYSQLVVALGTVPFTFLAAQVAHVTPVDEDGKQQHLVGCRFDHRIRT